MKPMQLKEPTKCCGSSIAVWIKGKGYYACPCGELKVNQYGLPMRRFVCFNEKNKAKTKAKT